MSPPATTQLCHPPPRHSYVVQTTIEPSNINNNNNQKNEADSIKSVDEVLLSLDLKVKELETTKTVSQSEEKAERQKVKVEFPIFENFNLTESEKAEVNKKLASLTPTQRDIAIQAISTAIMDDDIMYIRNILARGMKGELKPFKKRNNVTPASTPTPTQESLFTPVSDEIREIEQKERASQLNNTRLEIIKDMVKRKKAELLAEFNEKKFVLIRGLSGVVIEPDLRAAGLFD